MPLLMKHLCTSVVICVTLVLATDVVLAQPPSGTRGAAPSQGRGGFYFGTEPNLSRELRNQAFAEKIELTNDQIQLLNKLEMRRREYFREGFRGVNFDTEEMQKRREEIQAKFKEFDEETVEILTPEQKAIWEERKTEVKREMAAREAARSTAVDRPPAAEPSAAVSRSNAPEPQSDRERIRVLEEDVRLLKEELAMLKRIRALEDDVKLLNEEITKLKSAAK